jgi:hypothetical protein
VPGGSLNTDPKTGLIAKMFGNKGKRKTIIIYTS